MKVLYLCALMLNAFVLLGQETGSCKIDFEDFHNHPNDLQGYENVNIIAEGDNHVWNLSESALERKRLSIDVAKEVCSYSLKLKAASGNAAYGIMGNKGFDEKDKAGWTISITSTGTWVFSIFDGEKDYKIYQATPDRQNLRDGEWHEIGLNLFEKDKQAQLFFDGQQVAILNLSFINDFGNKRIFIGNLKHEGYYVERNTFNGYIDDICIGQTALKETGSVISEHKTAEQLRVMTFNIWNGGRGHGREAGLGRIIELIKNENPDIIGVQETYESGAILADSLGYYYYLCNRNLSILSRFPIKKAFSFYRYKRCAAAIVELPDGKELMYCNTWLDYLPDYDTLIKKDKINADTLMVLEEETRGMESAAIVKDMSEWLTKTSELPIIMGGDFNAPSHLDWTKRNKDDHFGMTFKWPASSNMANAGFVDAYRDLYPYSSETKGITYSPLWTGAQYRIDYMYYKGKSLKARKARVIDQHPVKFPSDHAALVVDFKLIR